MKRSLIIFLLMLVCLTVFAASSMAETVRLGPKQTMNKPVSGQAALPVNKLNNISHMIVQGRSQTAVIDEWKLLVTQNPGINADKAIVHVIQKAIHEWGKSGKGLNSIAQSYNLQQLQLQNALQREERMIQMMMNIMKQMHDTAEACVQNIR